VSLAFRPATLDDCERLGAQSLRAFPYPAATLAQRVDRYRQERISPIETVTIAERNGAMVGAMRRIPFTGWLGGVAVPVGGLAGVAVAPEARQTGVAAMLIRRHLEELAERRMPWSFLYPFSPKFYAKQGWAPAARQLRWRVRPEALPRARDRVALRRLALDDAADRAAAQACYERHCARTSGSLSRTAEQLGWQHEGRFVVGVPGPQGLAGYLVYEIRAASARPQLLVVHEWIADDGGAERALLGFLATQRDQADEVTIDTSPDYPLSSLLDNGIPPLESDQLPDEHHALATLASGLMARAVDLAGAARGRGYPGVANGVVALRVEHDGLVAANVGTVTVVVEGGAVDVAAGHAAGAPLVSGPIGPVSAVLVGGLRVEQAARLGLVSVEGDAAAASSVLALPPPAPIITF
jgi:predicted acetyltransferase